MGVEMPTIDYYRERGQKATVGYYIGGWKRLQGRRVGSCQISLIIHNLPAAKAAISTIQSTLFCVICIFPEDVHTFTSHI